MERLQSDTVKRIIYAALWLVASIGLIVLLVATHHPHGHYFCTHPGVPPGGIC